MTEPQLVVGGTVAALATADALAAAGRPVRLLLPRRGVGGGFLPLERDGRRLELGMRVLELHYEGTGTPPPLAEYRADDEGHRPFVALVDGWVRDLVGADAVVPVDPPASWLGGRLGPEVLLSSDLSRAAGLVAPDDARRIAGQAADAAREHGDAGWLAAGESGRLAEAGFDEASLHQHGARFHELFLAPFTGKIRPGGGADVLASLRRKLWVPLFWPRTVAEAFSGQPVGFVPERPLTVVRPGGMGPVLRALLDRLRARQVTVETYDRLTAVAPGGPAVRLGFADGREETAARPVLGLSAAELFAAAGVEYAPDRLHSVLAWVGVREDDLAELPGFVHVLDPGVPAYRVTPGERGDDGVRVVCVELAHDVPQEQAAATAVAVLETTGLLREGAGGTDLGVFSGPTFTDPTAANVARHAAALAAWQDLGVDAAVVGGAGSFGADSFNEQVLQGLSTAERLA
ncbi:hypothetical protein [Geodermatophilus nigrescens]|uniref:Oxygen-dependent protoporphyrinogen oxidase n=1 Tax=Geodermatophilus nigrescens TaxID=1070870 RepID=A0A1M5ECD2_9ACTN|nr:hypothetical protein [Geodermatophilus nigrescens]SHF76752.1 hypothetical protein SAMN05444351_0733 [Geodermatophilus nigrescens]